MCWVTKLFKRKSSPLTLPFPEEAPDPTATVDSISPRGLLAMWVLKYQPVDPIFWQSLKITVSNTISNAAETISELRQIKIRPEFCNEGTFAHECAHISYSLLDEATRTDFAEDFDEVKDAVLVALMLKTHPYAKTNMVEAHADTYRYLCHAMPMILTPYYPHLL